RRYAIWVGCCRVPKGTLFYRLFIPAIVMAGYQCHAPMGLAAHRFHSLELELNDMFKNLAKH
ncbi:MAG: hypothetical protein K6D37_11170, partial [Prevotella sp.]|nr:hypothetical protein [Prevotella sp.]